MSNTNDFQLNANYQGDNLETAKWQARADACAAEIGRLRRETKCTLTALDRIEIQETVVLWDNAYDGLDKETFLDLMTDDFEYHTSAFGEMTGKPAMSDWFDTFTRTFTGKRHLLSNFVIVGEGDHAKMLSYLTVFERILHTEMVATAIYFDELVKLNDSWKMKKRLQVLDPGMTQTEYGKSLINKYVASLSR